MTKIEIHVFDTGISQCYRQYVTELVRTRTRYCHVSLCVDDAQQAQQWREELSHISKVEVFNQDADLPPIPFQGEMLVTLSSQVSPLFSAFKQTIDLVADTETAREEGRMRYRFYRERGYPLRHIKVEDKESTT